MLTCGFHAEVAEMGALIGGLQGTGAAFVRTVKTASGARAVQIVRQIYHRTRSSIEAHPFKRAWVCPSWGRAV